MLLVHLQALRILTAWCDAVEISWCEMRDVRRMVAEDKMNYGVVRGCCSYIWEIDVHRMKRIMGYAA